MVISSIACKSSKHSSIKRAKVGIWQAQPITIDGSNKDWPSPYPEYDDKAQIGYAVSNDKDNLYITVETGDPATQLKIIKEGLTVWIDRKGEKNELTAINFPIPDNTKESSSTHQSSGSGQYQGQSSAQQQKQRMDLEDRVKKAMEGANQYSLQGFKSCNLQFPIMENDTCGIKVRMAIDEDNELVWEAVVPFKTFYFKPELTRPDRGRAVSVCFETIAMKRPAGQGNGGHSNGGSSGGMRPSFGMGGGMGMGMRMGGGGNRGGSRNNNQANDPMESAYKSTKTWKQFGLAFQ